jgi:hypothetical protein
MREKGHPIGQTGVPMREKGHPIGQTGVPMREKGHPIGQTGVPVSKRDAPPFLERLPSLIDTVTNEREGLSELSCS